MFEYDDLQHCPHCDGVEFSADPADSVTITDEGVRVDGFDCRSCGAGLYPTDLIPGHIVPMET